MKIRTNNKAGLAESNVSRLMQFPYRSPDGGDTREQYPSGTGGNHMDSIPLGGPKGASWSRFL